MSAPARQLFGTDGIRGEAGRYPLTPETMVRLGQTAADVFASRGGGTADPGSENPAAIVGKDTRRSGDMLEAAIAAGLNSRGVDARLAGVIPTPAVAFLTRDTGAAFGIVISASHNPFQDNGVKFFGADGYKLDDGVESAIEQRLVAEKVDPPREPLKAARTGRILKLDGAAERYAAFVVAGAGGGDPGLLAGLKIALDSANGAACGTSEAILKALGAEVIPFHHRPDGVNINRDCGCTHPAVIEALVRETGADVGVSHDGDADRVALCDETGSALDGDELMAIAAADLLERGRLAKKTVVATVMSNAGLDAVMTARGGRVVRSAVGDRYVMEEMRRGGFNFGGEQSGHLIFRDLNTTGDGIVAAIQILSALKRSGRPLSQLRTLLEKFPQAQRNVPVRSKPPVADLKEAVRAIRSAEQSLGPAGRVLIRYSGTESLLRVLVEGRDRRTIEGFADEIAGAIAAEIGG